MLKIFQLIANGLVLASSVLFIAVPQLSYAVFFGRFIVGAAGGIGYVAVSEFDVCFQLVLILIEFSRI